MWTQLTTVRVRSLREMFYQNPQWTQNCLNNQENLVSVIITEENTTDGYKFKGILGVAITKLGILNGLAKHPCICNN